MEGRLLDSPCSDECLPSRDYGVAPRSPPEEERAVLGCCAVQQQLEAAGSDMDTIPEEETGSASSELLTESSHLDSDRSEPEDSSESPLPRDTPEEGSGE
ncbi:hypothetical protein V5799_005400 [Amblyomma americanum]|uniref:Uncharacterized protein n=1 Tax=Amblyomma americanum TaxID=6943 RepID=A0AAQ4DZC8_AMBAM